MAFTRFKSYSDKANAIKLITEQPVEYRGGLAINEQYPFPYHLNPWFLEDLYYFLRRIYYEANILPFLALPYPNNANMLWRKFKQNDNDNDYDFLMRFFKNFALYILHSILTRR